MRPIFQKKKNIVAPLAPHPHTTYFFLTLKDSPKMRVCLDHSFALGSGNEDMQRDREKANDAHLSVCLI